MYVHELGYIGGNHTYEGALAMARKALQMRMADLTLSDRSKPP